MFLAIGVLLAVLFLLFPAQIYEGIRYFDGGYSNEMYNYGVYDTFALIMLLVTWLSYLSESIQMVFVNVLMAAVWYVVASFSIRWWSSNCRHSPF